MKLQEVKGIVIEQLRKFPIIQFVCEKADISRATYYRWRTEDSKFRKETDEAIIEGTARVNDLAESQLISAIRDKNLGAITYWLKHRHPSYRSRLEISTSEVLEKLTPEQNKLLKQALRVSKVGNQKFVAPKPYEESQ